MCRRPDATGDTPSPGWRPRPWWPLTWSLALWVAGHLGDRIITAIREEIHTMGAKFDAAINDLKADVTLLGDAYKASRTEVEGLKTDKAALVAERDALRAALESADANAAAQVAAAEERVEEANAQLVAEADAIVEGLLPKVEALPAEEAPSEPASGGDEVATDEG